MCCNVDDPDAVPMVRQFRIRWFDTDHHAVDRLCASVLDDESVAVRQIEQVLLTVVSDGYVIRVHSDVDELIYTEEFDDKNEAMRREYAIKQLSRAEKEKLIKWKSQ